MNMLKISKSINADGRTVLSMPVGKYTAESHPLKTVGEALLSLAKTVSELERLNNYGLEVGDCVRHQMYGEGCVKDFFLSYGSWRVVIDFDNHTKELILGYAHHKLTKITKENK